MIFINFLVITFMIIKALFLIIRKIFMWAESKKKGLAPDRAAIVQKVVSAQDCAESSSSVSEGEPSSENMIPIRAVRPGRN